MRKFLISTIGLILLAMIVVPFFVSAQGIVPCGTEKYPIGEIIGGRDVGGQISNPCNICHLFEGINNIINFMLIDIAVPLAIIILLYGGFLWITAGGDSGKITDGQKAIRLALIGMLWAFAAWIIIDTIMRGLMVSTGGQIQGWGPWTTIPSC
jgi:hypothetical protein